MTRIDLKSQSRPKLQLLRFLALKLELPCMLHENEKHCNTDARYKCSRNTTIHTSRKQRQMQATMHQDNTSLHQQPPLASSGAVRGERGQ